VVAVLELGGAALQRGDDEVIGAALERVAGDVRRRAEIVRRATARRGACEERAIVLAFRERRIGLIARETRGRRAISERDRAERLAAVAAGPVAERSRVPARERVLPARVQGVAPTRDGVAGCIGRGAEGPIRARLAASGLVGVLRARARAARHDGRAIGVTGQRSARRPRRRAPAARRERERRDEPREYRPRRHVRRGAHFIMSSVAIALGARAAVKKPQCAPTAPSPDVAFQFSSIAEKYQAGRLRARKPASVSR
jgi:hypothetical protein